MARVGALHQCPLEVALCYEIYADVRHSCDPSHSSVMLTCAHFGDPYPNEGIHSTTKSSASISSQILQRQRKQKTQKAARAYLSYLLTIYSPAIFFIIYYVFVCCGVIFFWHSKSLGQSLSFYASLYRGIMCGDVKGKKARKGFTCTRRRIVVELYACYADVRRSYTHYHYQHSDGVGFSKAVQSKPSLQSRPTRSAKRKSCCGSLTNATARLLLTSER